MKAFGLLKAVLGGGFALALSLAPAVADVTVRLLHVNETGDPYWKKIAEDYNATHKGVHVVVDYMENEAYKAKLPTLLQSDDRPDIIYSWAGGVMKAQIEAGYIQDISAAKADFDKVIYPAPLSAYEVDGKLYGVAVQLSEVLLIYNKPMLAKTGVDPSAMKTWDGFLDVLKKTKGAGVTPLIMGGGDKWPMHFFYSYLLMRLGGSDVLTKAETTEKGFTVQPFIDAGAKLKDLAALEPFQSGWLGTKYLPSQGLFGDGKGAMALQLNGFIQGQQKNATDGKGIPNDQLGLAPFPELPGGKGKITDTLGGVQGFLVTKSAPPEAIDFLKYFVSVEAQKASAEAGIYVPATKGTSDFIKNPLVKEIAGAIEHSTWHQNFLDQDLGPSVGRVVNDVSVGIAAGDMTPEEGAQQIQDAWDQR
jgi:raffinose/stachyose/melibiose transport system substrate-binding protein